MAEAHPQLEERSIEFDGLAIALLTAAFAGAALLTVWAASAAAQRLDAAVVVAGGVVGAGVAGAWVFGYPRHAAIPAMSLVILVALIALPAVFRMDGALLRESGGTPAGHLYIAIGLYVGGLGIAFLAFLVFGFLGPLVGAWLRVRRREARAKETLALHSAMTAAALALTFFPRLWL